MPKRRKAAWLGCTGPRPLPPARRARAAAGAVRINPANAPPPRALALLATALDGPPAPEHIAMLTGSYWGAGGVHLTVSFMEKTSAALQDKILAEMNAWRTEAKPGANVTFTRVDSRGQVRISRGRGGYWSYLGTGIRLIPLSQPTMNLEAFSLSTPDSEYKRVVRHETGHTLGSPHEHMRRQIVDLLDPEKTQEYFQRTQGWSALEVRQQVLTPLDENSIRGTPDADQDSIMCYDIPGECTRSGEPVRGGADIDQLDAQFMASQYPLAAPPPGPNLSPELLELLRKLYKLLGGL